MLIKLIGGAIILGVAISLSISHVKYEDRRLRTIDGFISLLFYIKGQIDCYSLPISDILMTLSPKILADCNSEDGVFSLDELVENSRIYLNEESERLLDSFCAEFGSVFRTEQISRTAHYIAALSEQRKLVECEVEKGRRVWSALYICCSLGLLILFW